jgi:hypothetical protein
MSDVSEVASPDEVELIQVTFRPESAGAFAWWAPVWAGIATCRVGRDARRLTYRPAAGVVVLERVDNGPNLIIPIVNLSSMMELR